MKHTAQIEVLSKQKALMMADYLSDYGIDVTEVILSPDGQGTIFCNGKSSDIRQAINQFNNEYSDLCL